MGVPSRLPKGFGSIRYLGAGRNRPYAVQTPQKKGVRPRILCYVSDWYVGIAVLTAYHAGRYQKGMEWTLEKPFEAGDIDEYLRQVSRYAAEIRGEKIAFTLKEVYEEYINDKFGDSGRRRYSESTKKSTEAAFRHLIPFYYRPMNSLTVSELQELLNLKGRSVDQGGESLSESTVSNILGLLGQL